MAEGTRTMKKDDKSGIFGRAALVAAACFALGGCATTQTGAASSGGGDDTEISDPMEGYNRAMFAVNDAVDKTIIEPVARGYRAVVPDPARKGVRNFLRNLRTPVNAANQLLQGDIEGMASDLSRAVINTTI